MAAVPTKEEMIQAIPATTAAFSNFDVLGGTAIDNIKAAKEIADKNFYGDPQQAKNDDLKDIAIDAAMDTMRDMQRKQLEKLYSVNGYEFTGADLDTTLDEIINDKDAFVTKHDLTEEEADLALTHALIMKDMTPEERADYLRDLNETDPAIAKAISSDAEGKLLDRENRLEKSETILQSTEIDSMLSDPSNSVIKQTFCEEVAGIGANAQSFILPSETSNIDITQVADKSATQYDHTENKFVLDM